MKLLRTLAICSMALAVSGAYSAAWAQPAEAPAQADMAMPDDLGAPLDGATVEVPAVERTLSVKSSIVAIAASAQGRAVLDKDLPGLRQRPEYMMFKTMSPAKLAALSRGRITEADLTKLQTDLMRVSYSGVPLTHTHSIFTRSGQAVGRVSKAVYHRVALMIASL